jgi:hypothetical protein
VAVCTLVTSRCSEDAKLRLPGVVRSLVDNRYAIEAAYALPSLPLENQEVLSKEIIAMLRRWHKTLDFFPHELSDLMGAQDGTVQFIEAIRQKRLHEPPAACFSLLSYELGGLTNMVLDKTTGFSWLAVH